MCYLCHAFQTVNSFKQWLNFNSQSFRWIRNKLNFSLNRPNVGNRTTHAQQTDRSKQKNFSIQFRRSLSLSVFESQQNQRARYGDQHWLHCGMCVDFPVVWMQIMMFWANIGRTCGHTQHSPYSMRKVFWLTCTGRRLFGSIVRRWCAQLSGTAQLTIFAAITFEGSAKGNKEKKMNIFLKSVKRLWPKWDYVQAGLDSELE